MPFITSLEKNTDLFFYKNIISYIEANIGNCDLLKISEEFCVKEGIWQSSA